MNPRGIWTPEGEVSVEKFMEEYELSGGVWIPKRTPKIPWFHLHDLSPDQQYLLHGARRARRSAYAPYSNFLVGIAAETSAGNLRTGRNNENAIFDVTHGEGCLLATLEWQDMAHINNLAVVAAPDEEKRPLEAATEPVLPCGKCRQMIWEFCDRNKRMPIYMSDPLLSRVWITTIGEIFPFPFGPHVLGIDPQEYMRKRAEAVLAGRQA